MGAREDLLTGAVRCLLEKGYARTTARDIAAASGANLASIGYHYGSKRALMREALFQATSEWGDDVERVLAERVPAHADPAARRQVAWRTAVDLFETHHGLWRAQLEAVLEAAVDPELREALHIVRPQAHRGLVALFEGVPYDEVTEEDVSRLGPFYMTLTCGLMAQQLAGFSDVSGEGMADALRHLTEGRATAP